MKAILSATREEIDLTRRLLSLEDPLAQLVALAIWRLRDWRYWLYCSWRASHRTTTAWRNGVTRCTRCGRTWQR